MRQAKTLFFTALVLSLLALPPAFAHYDYKFDTHELKMGNFESEIAGKFQRGVTNILFGWTEIVRAPTVIASEPYSGSFFKAITLGIPYGIVRAVGRTVVGAYEIATCYVPQKPIFAPLEGDVA